MADGRLTAAEAAARLGVKAATLYAYVSRELLRSERAADGRASLFDPAEVEALAARGRGGAQTRAPEPVFRSALTLLTGDALYYRGLDAGALARARTFEETAEWLWTGTFPSARAAWRADPATTAAGAEAQVRLPADALPLDRLRVIVAVAAPLDGRRADLRPGPVANTARSLVATIVDCLPQLRPSIAGPLVIGGAAAPTASLAARLWVRLSSTAPPPGMLDALNAALVLLADHELAPSTLAARIAASVRADAYAVVSAGLAVLGGARHGAASLVVEDVLAELVQPEAADALIGERLRRGELMPGLGHRIYTAGDPRARVLLRLVRAAARAEPLRLARVDAVLEAAQERGLPPPNIDFALGALAHVAGMTRGSGEAVFAVARTAGWVAHALEEYTQPTAFRPRAAYAGVAPERG